MRGSPESDFAERGRFGSEDQAINIPFASSREQRHFAKSSSMNVTHDIPRKRNLSVQAQPLGLRKGFGQTSPDPVHSSKKLNPFENMYED
jgi:hypothetical protein